MQTLTARRIRKSDRQAVNAAPAWRREPPVMARRFRIARFAAVWLAVLLAASGLIWASAWLSLPQPVRAVLIGAGYEDNLAIAHNVYGWQSLVDLAELCRQTTDTTLFGDALLSLERDPLVYERGTPWDAQLEGFNASTLLLVMAIHGGADAQGAYLLPSDASASDDSERLRLTDVLDRLARMPAEVNKVLILDATYIIADWRLGMLQNDFARELDALSDRIASIPNLVVLSASGPDERSWVCEEWRQTIFMHAVIEALRGAASDRDQDGRIDAWEVLDFARRYVGPWVASNRAALQTPVLLPRGELGRKRAQAMDLTLAPRHYTPPDPHLTPAFVAPPELMAAWQRYADLAGQQPAPEVYAPSVWRLYTATLLRFEQLVRAGANDFAVPMHDRLADLEFAIEQTRFVELASVGNTTTMRVAAGEPMSVEPAEASSKQRGTPLDQLWAATPQQYSSVWMKLAAAASGTALDRELLRVSVLASLVTRVATDPRGLLDQGVAILHALDDPIAPRPVEAQVMAMLARDLPRDVATAELYALVGQALDLRLLAERAAVNVPLSPSEYAYSEKACGWIRSSINQADAARRQGEDLLFSGPNDWADAKQFLDQAHSQYVTAAEVGAQVRAAAGVRDSVMAMLPYYSKWIACRSGNHVAPAGEDDPMLRSVEQLWSDVHALADMLEAPAEPAAALGPAAAPSPPAPSATALAVQSERVRRGFADLEQTVVGGWRQLAELDLPSVWRDADDALMVPQRDPQLRMALLTNKRNTARRLLIETANRASDGSAIGMAEQIAQRMAMAQRQGRMALAVLGQRVIEGGNAQGESYAQLRHRLDVFQVEAEWWKSVACVGLEVARVWQSMAGDITQLVDQSHRADPTQIEQRLAQADRRTRLLDAPGAESLTTNPAMELRRFLLHKLLLWQVERTLADHWYSEDPQTEPYFRTAASSFLGDAQRICAWSPSLAAAAQQIAASAGLAAAPISHVNLTTELALGVDLRLVIAPTTTLGPGFAAVWAAPGPKLELTTPNGGGRTSRRIVTGQQPAPFTANISSHDLQAAETTPPIQPLEQSSLTLAALFRGQRIELDVPVTIHLVPDTLIRERPLPTRASIAVRAPASLAARYGSSTGAVAIVLDCSGSMGPARGKPFAADTKYAEATRALRSVLTGIPQGTMVSLWTFGEAVGTAKTVTAAEQTIRQVLSSTVWDPNDQRLVDDVMHRVEYPAAEPWNQSPIMRAILSAKKDVEQSQGMRSIVVVSDGMDNRFATDHQANPLGKDIPTVLRETFQHSGVALDFIGFKVEDAEEQHAREQFQVVEQFFPPGRFTTVDDCESLIKALDTSLDQRLRYTLENYDSSPVAGLPAAGLDVGRAGANDQWLPGGIAPGPYRLRLTANRMIDRVAVLNRGDLLLAKLVNDAAGVQLERVILSKDDYGWLPAVEQSSWRLALLENQKLTSGGVSMLATLELLTGADATLLEQFRPREVWIELAPQSVQGPAPATSWSYTTGYAAPAWSINAATWPDDAATSRPAAPEMRVWWSPDQEAAASAALARGSDFQSIGELTGRSVRVEGDEVRIESLGVEQHSVEVRPSVFQTQPCLVVRLNYAPKKPILVRVGGVAVAGQEHRFYADVGCYTAFFWPVTVDEADVRLSSVKLISIEGFKRDAAERGFSIRWDDLGPPQPRDVRPQPNFVFE